MRSLRTTIRLIFPALLVFTAVSVQAQTNTTNNNPSTYTAPTQLYDSPNISAFGIPTGLLSIDTPNQAKIFDTTPATVTTPLSVVSATSVLGCGGVGQGEYTSALFNMPEVFSKFQNDVNSPLAKALLTMNYSLPQTAALFDTLNSYGNQRYDQFQRGCNLDALKQDAKQQYLQACVAEQVPLRTSIIGTQNPTVQEPMKSSQAYAQAWEICQMQYVSNTQALAQRINVATAFAKEIRGAEYANIAIRSMVCGVSDTTTNGCWQELLLPQVKVCNDSTLEGGCNPDGYGVEEAPIRMLPLFDTLRLSVTEDISRKVVSKLVSQLNSQGVDGASQIAAAETAAMNMTQPFKAAATHSLIDFEKNYLNCRSPDLIYPLKQFVTAINATAKPATAITAPALDSPPFQSNVNVLLSTVPSTADAGFTKDKDDFKNYVYSAIGCVTNQTIPMLDPMIIVQTNLQCTADDMDAFYALASYDVATTAIRETYEYLVDRLKSAQARLQIEDIRPETTGSDLGKIPSKELNRRLATVIKDLMIPHLENQIRRLEQINAARGEFGSRIKQIYADKAGCVYTQRRTSKN
jgi:hypothetical protein